MDISAHAISLADQPRTGCLGHQCSHALGRPIPCKRLISLRNARSPETISRLNQRSRARRSATICDRRSAFVPAAIGCGGFCHIVAERLVGQRAASRRRQFGVDARFWRPALRRRQTRAPESISNRYNATMPAAQALPGGWQPLHRGPCSALKSTGNPCGTAVVAL